MAVLFQGPSQLLVIILTEENETSTQHVVRRSG